MIAIYRKIENIWFGWPQKLRFLLVGGFNTLVSYFLFVGLEKIINYNAALFLTYLLCINLSIFTMRYYVFRAKGSIAAQYCKAAGTYIGMILVNYIALWIMIDECQLSTWLAQAIFTILSTTMIYLLHKHINFCNK